METRIKTDLTGEPISLDDLFNYIKFEDENPPEESLISNMLSAVRSHFEKVTGLSFAEKTYETLFHYNDKPFILPVQPVISVDSVELLDYLGEKTSLTLNTDYYKKGIYEVEIVTSEMTGWANPLRAFSGYYDLFVTYKAGYGHEDTEPLPADLKDAIMKQVKQWYDNRDDFYEYKILGSINKVLQLHKIKVL